MVTSLRPSVPSLSLILLSHVPHRLSACAETASCFSARLAFIKSSPLYQVRQYRAALPTSGTTTPVPENLTKGVSQSPYRLETGYALRPKRPSRPFPPPFVSLPSTSFSDPLTTHTRPRDRRPSVRGELIRGLTNGDDAVLASENYLGVNDGVGAWATKSEGHAALWSRLILHFWALECERLVLDLGDQPRVVQLLQEAFRETVEATKQWQGTTTSVTALLHHSNVGDSTQPLLYVTNIGDCKILVIRPAEKKVLFKTQEQWHWFDCPYQLGTNSADTPVKDAVLSTVEVAENDVIVAVSDGVMDNLWEHEVVTCVVESIQKWEAGEAEGSETLTREERAYGSGGMVFVAKQLLEAAANIAHDPFAESPYMERAIDEGLSIEGGKLDDISVVIGLCKKRKS